MLFLFLVGFYSFQKLFTDIMKLLENIKGLIKFCQGSSHDERVHVRGDRREYQPGKMLFNQGFEMGVVVNSQAELSSPRRI